MPKSQHPQTAGWMFAYTEILLDETIRFAIMPMDVFGNRGKTIYSKIRKIMKPDKPPKPAEKTAEKSAAK